MIADCETCERRQVPCSGCEESQRTICFICQGDVADPYCELDEHAPKLARDVTHAHIGSLLRDIRGTVDDLISIRSRGNSDLLDGEYGELYATWNSLGWLLSDIRGTIEFEERKKATMAAKRHANVVRFIHGKAK